MPPPQHDRRVHPANRARACKAIYEPNDHEHCYHDYWCPRHFANVCCICKKLGSLPAFMRSFAAFWANVAGSFTVRFANVAAADLNESEELLYVATSAW